MRWTSSRASASPSNKGRGAEHHRLLRQRQDHAAALPATSLKCRDSGRITVNTEAGAHVLFDAQTPRQSSPTRRVQEKAPALWAGIPELQPLPAVHGACRTSPSRPSCWPRNSRDVQGRFQGDSKEPSTTAAWSFSAQMGLRRPREAITRISSPAASSSASPIARALALEPGHSLL